MCFVNFFSGEKLNVWIFEKNGDLNVWIFVRMALQGIVDNKRTLRFCGWEMEVDLDGMIDKKFTFG